MKERIMSISFLAAVTAVFALGSGSVAATGLCKALDQEACMESTGCRWVKGYERADGRKVASYCRKLPSSKVEKEASPPSRKEG